MKENIHGKSRYYSCGWVYIGAIPLVMFLDLVGSEASFEPL